MSPVYPRLRARCEGPNAFFTDSRTFLTGVDAGLPGTQSYISMVVKMNRDNGRSTARSVANQEFHPSGEIMNEAAHRIARALPDAGYRTIDPSVGMGERALAPFSSHKNHIYHINHTSTAINYINK